MPFSAEIPADVPSRACIFLGSDRREKKHVLSLPSPPWEEKGCPQKHHLCQEHQGWAEALVYPPGWLGKAAPEGPGSWTAPPPPETPQRAPALTTTMCVSSEPRALGRLPRLTAGCCGRGAERPRSGAKSAAGKAKLWLAQPSAPSTALRTSLGWQEGIRPELAHALASCSSTGAQ